MSQGGNQHHGTYRGRWCKLKLANGNEEFDKFVESKSTRLRFERLGWISRANVISFEPFERDPEKKEQMRVSIREIQKPVFIREFEKPREERQAVPVAEERPPMTPEEARKTINGFKPYLHRLPSGYLLSLYIPNALGLAKATDMLGLTLLDLEKPDEKAVYHVLSQEEEEKFERITRPSFPKQIFKEETVQAPIEGFKSRSLLGKQPSVQGTQICSFCGKEYQVLRLRTIPTKYRCCRERKCRSAYQVARMRDKREIR